MRVQVRSRIPGQDQLPDILVELADHPTTVRELIRVAVEEQIRSWRADPARCRGLLDRQFLTEDEVRAQAATGVVRLPGGEPDLETEVARAWRAFERRAFVILAGGSQVDGLDDDKKSSVLAMGKRSLRHMACDCPVAPPP